MLNSVDENSLDAAEEEAPEDITIRITQTK